VGVGAAACGMAACGTAGGEAAVGGMAAAAATGAGVAARRGAAAAGAMVVAALAVVAEAWVRLAMLAGGAFPTAPVGRQAAGFGGMAVQGGHAATVAAFAPDMTGAGEQMFGAAGAAEATEEDGMLLAQHKEGWPCSLYHFSFSGFSKYFRFFRWTLAFSLPAHPCSPA